MRARRAPPTQFVRGGEGGGQAVVLDDGAAPPGVTDRPHVRHPQGVAGPGPAQVLDHRQHAGLARELGCVNIVVNTT